jgi:hypothetical protein
MRTAPVFVRSFVHSFAPAVLTAVRASSSWIQPAAIAARPAAKKAAQMPLFFSGARSLHTSSSRASADGKKPSPLDSLPSLDSARLVRLSNEAVEKLQGATTHQLFTWSSFGLLALTPVAVVLSPHLICFPVDFALGLVIPAHMHIGLVGVVEDYVSVKDKQTRRAERSNVLLLLRALAERRGISVLRISKISTLVAHSLVYPFCCRLFCCFLFFCVQSPSFSGCRSFGPRRVGGVDGHRIVESEFVRCGNHGECEIALATTEAHP